MNLRLAALTLSLILPGCGGESGRSLAAVYDSAGVRIVENRDVEGDRTSNWTVSPEAILHLGGTSASEGAELFSELNGVTRLAGGEVVVLEGSLSELRFLGTEETVEVPAGESGPTESHPNRLLIRVSADRWRVAEIDDAHASAVGDGGRAWERCAGVGRAAGPNGRRHQQ